ncbi:MAG TPA: cyclic nucleotide-binding domain-containing protein [Mycobacteriales bacterium]|nr:cyclic nucleotide-binding domain-containing protein [Mycobacteriales bacterium]
MIRSGTRRWVGMLRSITLFEDLTDKQLLELTRLLDEVERPAGTVLTRQGSVGRESFILVRGEVTVLVHGAPVTRLGPGELIGEMALLNAQPRTATVIADTDVTLLVVGPAVFATLLDYRGVGRRVAAELSERLRFAEGDGAIHLEPPAAGSREPASGPDRTQVTT